MEPKLLEELISVYKPECRFLKEFSYYGEDKGIGKFQGISQGNTYHLTIDGDHFNNVPAYIAYNQFAIAFYYQELKKRGMSLREMKDNFLKMYVVKHQIQYKKPINKELFTGEITSTRLIEPRKGLIILSNEYHFDKSFFGNGKIVLDLR